MVSPVTSLFTIHINKVYSVQIIYKGKQQNFKKQQQHLIATYEKLDIRKIFLVFKC